MCFNSILTIFNSILTIFTSSLCAAFVRLQRIFPTSLVLCSLPAKYNSIVKCQNRLVTPFPTFSDSFHLQIAQQTGKLTKGCEAARVKQLDLCYLILLLASTNLEIFAIVKNFYFVVNSAVQHGIAREMFKQK